MTIGVVGRHLCPPCSRCGRRERTADDRYRLILPDDWTLDDLIPQASQCQSCWFEQLRDEGLMVGAHLPRLWRTQVAWP